MVSAGPVNDTGGRVSPRRLVWPPVQPPSCQQPNGLEQLVSAPDDGAPTVTARQLHVPTAVVAVSLTAALVNVAQYPAIELDMSQWYDAVAVKPGHDLDALVADHFGSTQERFELYTQLRELAPGATLQLPSSLNLFDEQLRGLGGLGDVVRTDEELRVDAEVAALLDEEVVAEGDNRTIGPYAIAVRGDGAVSLLVLVAAPERVYLAEESLLEAAGVAVPS